VRLQVTDDVEATALLRAWAAGQPGAATARSDRYQQLRAAPPRYAANAGHAATDGPRARGVLRLADQQQGFGRIAPNSSGWHHK
jgi:hypothetical protein